MESKCPACGSVVSNTVDFCKECGCEVKLYAAPITIRSAISGESTAAHKTSPSRVALVGANGLKLRPTGERFRVGRRECVGMFGEDARFVSREGQFELIRETELVWGIVPFAEARNPTHINDVPLTEQVSLKVDDVLRIGSLSLRVEYECE